MKALDHLFASTTVKNYYPISYHGCGCIAFTTAYLPDDGWFLLSKGFEEIRFGRVAIVRGSEEIEPIARNGLR